MTPKPASNTDADRLKVEKDSAQSDEAQVAGVALGGVAANALTARTFAAGTFGSLDVTECVKVLRLRAEATHAGDLKHAETVLTAQAANLDAIFNEMARRAALNMGEYMDATERYMRLALKAQSQCRTTLETLAAIKNPPVVFAKQTNIAHGPQQVNNGTGAHFATSTRPRTHPHAKNFQKRQNELLPDAHDGSTHMDPRATPAPARGDPAMEAVAAVHRSQDHGG
ncbi:hypothetical protein [Hydrogenophaga sp. IBVHS2]|uniref:hypothetical protein n=1 Tax=Hydrogenophaga sp. IBVHS2 TaxID=1985170 RepID=UPI000A2E38AC|nr:hypothetical protein [Hydrogenophaga sp. IBVHS2]OSZ65922.1 hypothetical protein CAP38_07775 [Hydrogenophaga sp. IBVHS2]